MAEKDAPISGSKVNSKKAEERNSPPNSCGEENGNKVAHYLRSFACVFVIYLSPYLNQKLLMSALSNLEISGSKFKS